MGGVGAPGHLNLSMRYHLSDPCRAV
jgi:hypothetical protein